MGSSSGQDDASARTPPHGRSYDAATARSTAVSSDPDLATDSLPDSMERHRAAVPIVRYRDLDDIGPLLLEQLAEVCVASGRVAGLVTPGGRLLIHR